jgi:hypothetical protein
LLDKRCNGFGGTCATCYSPHVLERYKNDMHPLSDFSINLPSDDKKHHANLWDWKLWRYLETDASDYKQFPIVRSGKFPSTISWNTFPKS